ncbi:carboxypeptidase regulatory-like domain-containing protein [Dehalococcoidia bacterium]|nr:carboxypeptidase regulatory-like domain-containing protein [Dehalococcoidia bacterium]
MKKRATFNIFAILMTALLAFSGVGWAALDPDNNPAARGPTPEEYGAITGRVTGVHGVGVAGAVVVLPKSDPTAVFGAVATDADGNYIITTLAPGAYEMKVRQPSDFHLGINLQPARISGIEVVAGVTTVVNVTLKLPGDANADGKVDASDMALVARAFNTKQGEVNFDPDADLNQDGIVDIFDLVKVGRNFSAGQDKQDWAKSTGSTSGLRLC